MKTAAAKIKRLCRRLKKDLPLLTYEEHALFHRIYNTYLSRPPSSRRRILKNIPPKFIRRLTYERLLDTRKQYLKNIRKISKPALVENYAISNEFSCSLLPYSQCHVYLASCEPYENQTTPEKS